MKICELFEVKEWKSVTGNKITTYFETEQGSKYILTDKNESKRNKSSHSNTGGEDKGLHEWKDHCIFVNSKFEYFANAPQFLANTFKLDEIKVSTKNNKLAFYHKGEILKFKDAYPKSGGDQPLVFEYTLKPTKDFNCVEYTLKSDGYSIKVWHFGSKVSKIEPISDELINKFKQ